MENNIRRHLAQYFVNYHTASSSHKCVPSDFPAMILSHLSIILELGLISSPFFWGGIISLSTKDAEVTLHIHTQLQFKASLIVSIELFIYLLTYWFTYLFISSLDTSRAACRRSPTNLPSSPGPRPASLHPPAIVCTIQWANSWREAPSVPSRQLLHYWHSVCSHGNHIFSKVIWTSASNEEDRRVRSWGLNPLHIHSHLGLSIDTIFHYFCIH